MLKFGPFKNEFKRRKFFAVITMSAGILLIVWLKEILQFFFKPIVWGIDLATVIGALAIYAAYKYIWHR